MTSSPTTNDTVAASAPRHPGAGGVILRKVVGVGVRIFFAGAQLRYRLGSPWSGKISHVDHITIPCGDLRIAEEFYVGLLGARVALRLDASRLERVGWSRQDIEEDHAAHLQLTLGSGPRLDLFEYPAGVPRADAPMHPHIALAVGPRTYLQWKRRLTERGVVVAGPTRPGPPGQASFYFNDPFGNHLELITIGFVSEVLGIGVPDRSALDYRWISG